VAEGAPLL